MKLTLAAAALFAVAATGCGKSPKVAVVFLGATPATSAVKSTRAPEFHCPYCSKVITNVDPPPKTCPSKACGAKLEWPDKAPCAYCGGTGDCPTCRIMKQEKGACYNCRGAGKLVLVGQTRPCP